jgi:competence protein ComEA
LGRERVRGAPLRPGERIDPNSASAEQLDRLPRVGPTVAERIVAHRTANGRFRTVDDLRKVSGIGPALLEAIGPYLTLPRGPPGGASAAGTAARIDLNRASANELQTLPGIGPAIAARIIEYRSANGPFRTFDELEKVSGIGPRLRERIQAAATL